MPIAFPRGYRILPTEKFTMLANLTSAFGSAHHISIPDTGI